MERLLDVRIFPDECILLVFVEAIQRKTEFAMDASAWILEAVRFFWAVL